MSGIADGCDPRVIRAQATRLSAQGAHQEELFLVREAPLEVRVNGHLQAVMMRTPGMETELVTGYLVCEGMVVSRSQIASVTLGSSTEDRVADSADVCLAEGVEPPAADEPVRLVRAVAGDVRQHGERSPPVVASSVQVSLGALSAAGQNLRAGQALRELAGGVHAFGLYRDGGERLVVCEDIGRHNAMDKAVGWCLGRGLDGAWAFGLCSGRLSYEMVAKAARVGLPVLVSFSSPSSLGVETADRCGITLVGYLKDGEARVYSHAHRVKL